MSQTVVSDGSSNEKIVRNGLQISEVPFMDSPRMEQDLEAQETPVKDESGFGFER